MTCKICGSHAINLNMEGRKSDAVDLCDRCYWKIRYEESIEALKELKIASGGSFVNWHRKFEKAISKIEIILNRVQ